MKKTVIRSYYPSGALRIESDLNEEGKPEGICREYYESGKLQNERRSEAGRLHGRSSQWSEDGRLLGEFVFEHGTGTFVEWYPNGQKKLEMEMSGGLQHGVQCLYDMNGKRCLRWYYLRDRKVTKKKFLEEEASQSLQPTPLKRRG